MRLLPVLLLLSCAGSEEPEGASGDVGTVTLRRLNRAEYDNTVRDLFGTTLRPAADFPADDFGYGFDNIGDVLSLSPLHLELYERAADTLVDELFGRLTAAEARQQIEAESSEARATGGGVHDATSWMLWDTGSVSASVWLAHEAVHRLEVRAFGIQDGSGPVPMILEVDGAEVAAFAVEAVEGAPETYDVEAALAPGLHELTVRYPDDADGGAGIGQSLVVDWIAAVGPLDLTLPPSPGGDRVLLCDPAEIAASDGLSLSVAEARCAEQILWTFGERAWRRPVTPAEHADKMAIYGATRDAGGTWEDAVGNVLKAVLLAPDFIYRVELDPVPDSAVAHPLSSWELATRLSYFLWSSMPDARLRDRARDGSLLEPAVLEAEARRMLADPKAEALVENLAGQWLFIRAVEEAAPDAGTFPEWDEGLRASMQDEMRLFVGDILLGDRSMLELLTAEETWVDQRLAEHYGLEGPDGPGFVKVSTAGTGRRGVLTLGGLLTATSYPTRTSPVKRGVWVLDNLLCEAPPPPPPGVEGLPEDQEQEALTLREQMEQHRADPVCASCHAVIDPIGFSLEHFDAVGRYRDTDAAGHPIDASGYLPGGQGTFDDVTGLSALLARDPKVPSCMVHKTFTYALGRAPGVGDLAWLEAIEGRFVSSGHRFEELAVAVVTSPPFRHRRGQP